MDKQNSSERKMIEFLWVEINRAIIKSPDVRACVENLKALNILNQASDYNLVLDVEKLVELIVNGSEIEASEAPPADESSSGLFSQLNLMGAKEEPVTSSDSLNQENISTSESNEAWSRKIKAIDGKPRIDGKVLSKNEILFHEFAARNFDEHSWMKQVGICWKE